MSSGIIVKPVLLAAATAVLCLTVQFSGTTAAEAGSQQFCTEYAQNYALRKTRRDARRSTAVGAGSGALIGSIANNSRGARRGAAIGAGVGLVAGTGNNYDFYFNRALSRCMRR